MAELPDSVVSEAKVMAEKFEQAVGSRQHLLWDLQTVYQAASQAYTKQVEQTLNQLHTRLAAQLR